MAVSLNDIKTKIASTKNTSQITNAMQMVSAAKLGRSEEAARNFQIYSQKVRKLLTDILHGNGAGGSTNPMLISRPVKKTGYIALCSTERQRFGWASVYRFCDRKRGECDCL